MAHLPRPWPSRIIGPVTGAEAGGQSGQQRPQRLAFQPRPPSLNVAPVQEIIHPDNRRAAAGCGQRPGQRRLSGTPAPVHRNQANSLGARTVTDLLRQPRQRSHPLPHGTIFDRLLPLWRAHPQLTAVFTPLPHQGEPAGYPQHAITAGRLPPIHRDPFDRMLVAQAQHET